VVTAKELAERYEVSLRTIYRDVNTLLDAGVPIGSENGVGYFIVDGYFLPPVMITEEEANALVVSEKLILNQGDNSLKKDFMSVLVKIKSVLRDSGKEKYSKLEERVVPSINKAAGESSWLSAIQKSIIGNNVLEINYHSISKEETTTRKVEPLGVYFTDKAWVMIAHCRMRNDLREFRLDRIIGLINTTEKFANRQDFTLNKYFKSFQTS